MAYDKYTLTSVRDLEYENPNALISIRAKIKIRPSAAGGRKTGIKSGYRPDHVFEWNNRGERAGTFIGDIVFEGKNIEPGEEREVTVRFLMNQPIEQYLDKERKWWMFEGPVLVAEGEFL